MRIAKASLWLQVSLFCLWGCGGGYQSFEGPTQGTSYHITADLPDGVSRETVQAAIDATLRSIDESLSTYRNDSEISRFNALPAGSKLAVSQHFINVLQVSREVFEQSGHVFDPSVKPLIDLWGFGSKVSLDNFRHVPDATAIARAREGLRFTDVSSEGRTVSKAAQLTLDFNGIAQGYTVDALKQALQLLGIRDAMIEVGGEVATIGASPRGTPWRIGIETPDTVEAGGNVFKALLLHDDYVSTSGDYRDYYEIDGKRYSHTIDPRTGMPISHALASVTVVAPSVALADAWCTALMVLGEKEGLQLAGQRGMAAYFIYRNGKGFSATYTAAMKPYLENDGLQGDKP